VDEMVRNEDDSRFARLVDQQLGGRDREEPPVSVDEQKARGIQFLGPPNPVMTPWPAYPSWLPLVAVGGGIALIVALAAWGPKR
jgi:hypothetical protein